MISGNTFVQGTHKENHSGLIVVSAEAHTYPSEGLTIVNNTASVAPGQEHVPAFVADGSKQRLRIADNKVGPGSSLSSNAEYSTPQGGEEGTAYNFPRTSRPRIRP